MQNMLWASAPPPPASKVELKALDTVYLSTVMLGVDKRIYTINACCGPW